MQVIGAVRVIGTVQVIDEGRTPVSQESPRFRAVLENFAPYQPGRRVSTPDGRSYKLSSNESPFGPLPSVAQVIAQAALDVNRYPDNGATALTEAIAQRFAVPPGHIAVSAQTVGMSPASGPPWVPEKLITRAVFANLTPRVEATPLIAVFSASTVASPLPSGLSTVG